MNVANQKVQPEGRTTIIRNAMKTKDRTKAETLIKQL